MDIVRVEESPCDQFCTCTPLSKAREVAPKDRTLLTVSSSSCCEAVGASSRTPAPAWLSVAVTSAFEVVLQTRLGDTAPRHSKDANSGSCDVDGRNNILASHLAACRGVQAHTSEPGFARVPCTNLHDVAGAYGNVVSLPATPECVIAADVSTRSTVPFSLLPEPSVKQPRQRTFSPLNALRGCTATSVAPEPVTARTQTSTSADNTEQHHSSSPTSGTPAEKDERHGRTHLRANAIATEAALVASIARELPTIALLLASPCRTTRALMVLRPVVTADRHPRDRPWKGTVAYEATMWAVSESAQRVAASPCGDAVFVVTDRFFRAAADVEKSHRGGGGGDGDDEGDATPKGLETHLALRGSCVSFEARREASAPVLRPLLLHVGLRGSPAGQRHALRALLRSAVSGAWCRCGLPLAHRPALGATHKVERAAVTELALYTTEGHALVFQPVHREGEEEEEKEAAEVAPCGNKTVSSRCRAAKTVAYTCCYGTRLPYSALIGSSAPMSVATASRSRRRLPLLIAPPWRFVDQWCHSLWFRKALERSSGGGSCFNGTDALCAAGSTSADVDGVLQRDLPHRHPPSSVLAMCPNRRVWLLRAGTRLSLVTVPSDHATPEAASDATNPTCTAALVTLTREFVLHDAQYVSVGGHGGFLLLGRVRGGGDGEGGEADGAGSGGGQHDVLRGGAGGHCTAPSCGERRYIHSTPASPLRLFFLSLLSVGGSLLPLPLRYSSTSHADSCAAEALFHPSLRLRFVCVAAAAAAGTASALSSTLSQKIFAAIASSGSPRRLWTVVGEVPSLSSWCSTQLQDALGEARCSSDRPAADAGLLPSRVQTGITHALTAAFPVAALAHDTRPVDAVGQTPGGWRASASPDTLAEVALLQLDAFSHHRYPDHEDERDATDAFLDILRGTLASCAAGHGCSSDAVACLTAVVAGFCAALRLSGVVCKAGATLPATFGLLHLLHRSAQLLRGALEDLCVVGHVSALLACVSHLAQSHHRVSRSVESVEAPLSVAAVWSQLLQPLFDLAWGVVHDYGLPTDVTADVLRHCSPAVQAMAEAGAYWWGSDSRDAGLKTAHDSTAAEIVAAAHDGEEEPAKETASVHGGGARRQADVILASTSSQQLSAVDASQRGQRLGSPAEASLSTPPLPSTVPPSSPPPNAYTSAELYEVVRRVFLLQGAAAALRLVQQLRQHESTCDGVEEMAQMYEAMQARLDHIAV